MNFCKMNNDLKVIKTIEISASVEQLLDALTKIYNFHLFTFVKKERK